MDEPQQNPGFQSALQEDPKTQGTHSEHDEYGVSGMLKYQGSTSEPKT